MVAESRKPSLLVVRWVSYALIVVACVVIVRSLPLDRGVDRLEGWVRDQGALGPIVFGAVYAVAAVLLIPGSPLSLVAGGVFGLALGTLVVSVASTLAAGMAFLIARFIARKKVEAQAARYPRFGAVDRAIGEQGWKIVFLLRLSPAFPYSISNYLYGLTGVRFWPYLIASWIAMLPGTFMYVYFGYAARLGLSAARPGDGVESTGKTVLLIVGLVATVAVTIYVTRLAARAIRQSTPLSSESAEAGKSTPEGSPSVSSTSETRRTPSLPVATVATALLAAGLVTLAGWAHAERDALQGVFGPPRVKMQEKYPESAGSPTFDHGAFDRILKAHVSPGGLVDYAALAAAPAPLEAYLDSLATAPYGELTGSERLAFLINAYNAFTLRLIAESYPVTSIKKLAAPWDTVRWNLGGKKFSLNQIEHEEIRPNFKEPRIHFALVCAAIGCPPLRAEAYTAKRLEEQLEAQSFHVHTHDRWYRYSADDNRLSLTKLYSWYGDDFAQEAGSVLEFVARYSSDVKKRLAEGKKPAVEFLDYDWSLNDRRSAGGERNP